MQEATRAIGVGRRRIILRPRLTRMLDESGARIILLVAPAGYGKTTLAQEWLGAEDRRSAWYRGGPASADVAALAVGLAQATSELVPGAGDRMRERLRATERPEEEAHLLGEMLAEDLAEWPQQAWVAIDDYHFAMESAAAEEFVDAIAGESPVQILITSRIRPTWASARRRVYGELLELDRTLLAMSDDEALELLTHNGGDASRLLEKAAGWPAVIGLAALTGDLSMPEEELPAALYDYFAEELYQAAEPGVRWGLCQLAIAPSITPELANVVFGEETATLILDHAVRLGVLIPTSGEFDLHPLLRSFLNRKLRAHGEAALAPVVEVVGRFFLSQRRWDEVFSIATEFSSTPLLVDLIEAATEETLLQGRLTTLARWLDHAEQKDISSALIDLAEAEIAFRRGHYGQTEALATEAARRLGSNHPLLTRAYSRAGLSAHFDGREHDALRYYRLAEQCSFDPPATKESLWGQFMSYLELEDGRAQTTLDRLTEVSGGTPDEMLRLAGGRFLLAVRRGAGLPDQLFSMVHLVSRANDPLIRSSFLNLCSGALSFAGRYREALGVSERQLHEAERYRLAFVLPHAYLRLATAYLGLGEFRRAHELLDRSEELAKSVDDAPVIFSAKITRSRAFISTGRFADAVAETSSGRPAGVSTGGYGEYLACRGLALAAMNRLSEAIEVVDLALKTTASLEATVLTQLTDVIIRSTRGDTEAPDLAKSIFWRLMKTSCIDSFVVAYRGWPAILSQFGEREAPALAIIMGRANDQTMAREAGVAGVPGDDPGAKLSKREREVLELLARGKTNKEIAGSLYIAESTVKVHVRRILEKLGVRTRTEAAVYWTRDRSTRLALPVKNPAPSD